MATKKRKAKEPDTRTDAQKRSFTMSRIKSRDTSIEVKFRKELYRAGVRYRVDYKKAPGKPDIAITRLKIAVFCDGEFWHGYDWERMKGKIKTRREYWIPKIERTMERDRAAREKLEEAGWIVLRFWGKQIEKNLDECVQKVLCAVFERSGSADAKGEKGLLAAAEAEEAYGKKESP